jgi:hypothetical protein
MDDWGNGEAIDSDNDYEDDDDDDMSDDDDDSSGSENDEDDEEDTIDEEIVEKFIRTFHVGGYDIELDNALCYDLGIPSSVWPTQASYISPITGLFGIDSDWRG